jgi:putative ABC transport system substrate-binding protein
MNRRFLGLVAVLFLASFDLATVQQQGKIARVGYLSLRGALSQAASVDVLRQALHELGYVEGKNVVFEYRFGGDKRHLAADMAAELVRLKVDVIVSGGAGATRAAKKATDTIPIVFAQDLDPVGNGFVTSLAKPGGNITGLSTLQVDLTGKRLELLKEVALRLSRIVVIGSPSIDNVRELKQTELAAAALGLTIKHFLMQNSKDIESTFQAAMKPRPDGLFFLTNSFERPYRKRIIDLAARSRLPAMYFGPTLVEDGGLMSYGVDDKDLHRRAAVYLDKILKGAKPADLPVEQPTKFELVINLQTAKRIGLAVPPNVLARADRVIR